VTSHELTEEQAKKLFDCKFWEPMSLRDRALFQMHEKRLCMPFIVFHEAVEKTLGRPVFTHEFAYPDLIKKELLGDREAPSMEEILGLVPADKRILLVAVQH